MLGTLAQQHADLDARRRANLAFSGQTLVGDNLDVLQDAVESIVAAFLLPARVGGWLAVGWGRRWVGGWMDVGCARVWAWVHVVRGARESHGLVSCAWVATVLGSD
jgi:hypothetical protein